MASVITVYLCKSVTVADVRKGFEKSSNSTTSYILYGVMTVAPWCPESCVNVSLKVKASLSLCKKGFYFNI